MKERIDLAHVTMTVLPEYCVGLALVADGCQLSGYRTVSCHISSSYSYSLDDMRGMGHPKVYEECCPDGYELVELGHFEANRCVSECQEEIVEAIRRQQLEGGEA